MSTNVKKWSKNSYNINNKNVGYTGLCEGCEQDFASDHQTCETEKRKKAVISDEKKIEP